MRSTNRDHMSGEPQPPWAISGSPTPVGDTHWHDPDAKAWLKNVFLPFYDNLASEAQQDYWLRWGAPQAWLTMFLHPDLDALFAEADGEGHAPEARDFRAELLN